MIKNYNYQTTSLLTTAPNIRSYWLPLDFGIEIAFVGRSNAGKSSALNTLTNQNLARTSKIPGRTQLINLFQVQPGLRLVDLPGYGYAKVPKKLKHKLQLALSEYLQKRNSLKGLVILMDIRQPMKKLDQQIIQWAVDVTIPVLVLLTKADKIVASKCQDHLIYVRQLVNGLAFGGDIQIEFFSSLNKQGLDKLREKLDTWFNTIPPTT